MRVGVFDLDGLQIVGVESEQGEDGRRDLGGLDLLPTGPVVADRVPGIDERDTAVLRIRRAVFGELALTAG